AQRISAQLQLVEFSGPHLTPEEGAYSPFDFLQVGLAARLEREFHFLLILTEVDLSASVQSYVLALPSQLTNIGIVSMMRLAPAYWGKQGGADVTAPRLATIMLHTLGHLLNLPHSPDRSNIMYDFRDVEALDGMKEISPEQVAMMERNLPLEAREEVGRGNLLRFAASRIVANRSSIFRAVLRANPLRLARHLPTMLTASFSLIIVLFFTAEIWDVATALALAALIIFSIISLAASTLLLYRSFALRAGSFRDRSLAESAVVTDAAIRLSVLLTMIVLYVVFFALSYTAAATFFPDPLKENWPTVDEATHVLDYIKLSMFLASMGVLAGSLGGSAERRNMVRHILFVDEES
ncbi:MAG TPA: hypothetical protein VER55_04705, partial [Ardenticatenaceae bacterium]|nr:hypothetical protein [Ardenticatenaceae bacterium]